MLPNKSDTKCNPYFLDVSEPIKSIHVTSSLLFPQLPWTETSRVRCRRYTSRCCEWWQRMTHSVLAEPGVRCEDVMRQTRVSQRRQTPVSLRWDTRVIQKHQRSILSQTTHAELIKLSSETALAIETLWICDCALLWGCVASAEGGSKGTLHSLPQQAGKDHWKK